LSRPPAASSRPVEIFRKKDRTGFRCAPSLRVYRKVGEGPRFHIVNRTPFTARVDFGKKPVVLDAATREPIREPILIPAAGSSVGLSVDDTLPPGRYPYTVLLVEAGIEAEGGSRPDIEIRK
jgi:hypothetical protein